MKHLIKKISLIAMVVMLSNFTLNKALAQEKLELTLTTAKAVGERIGIQFKGAITIDLGDGTRESHTSDGDMKYIDPKLKGSKIKIYGYLTFLSCDKQKITDINFSNAKNLEILSLAYNELKKVKIPNLPSLRVLSLGFSKINHFSINGCKKLEALIMYHNNLTGGFTMSDFPNLNYLYLDNNPLTSLEINNCEKLEGIDCHNNKLTKLYLYGKLEKLKHIKCYNNRIRGKEMDKLIESLNNTNIKDKKFRVVYANSRNDNEITSTQVQKARKKGWTVLQHIDEYYTQVYDGIKNTPIDDISATQVKVFPNPTTNILYIEGVKSFDTISIYSTNGILVYQSQADVEGKCSIDTSRFSDGIYFVKVANSTIKVLKI